MDNKREIILATKRIISFSNSLKNATSNSNTRLTQKYVSELKSSLDELMQALVSAEIEGVAETEPWIVEAKKYDTLGQTVLFKAEEYLLEKDEEEVCNANEIISKAKLNEVVLSITSFEESLETSASELVKCVEKSNQAKIVHDLINEKKEQFSYFKKQKIELYSTISNPAVTLKDFDAKCNSVSILLNEWIEKAITSFGRLDYSRPANSHTSKGPGLKLDRLSLPIFRGNVREFARFVREFNATVGIEFQDPKIKLMYLQNQCLSGPAKEMVRNLTSFDDVMSRLNERYGKVGLVVDSVLRDIRDLKLSDEEPNAVISLARVLELAWDDLSAINSLDEFCNVVTLGTLEGKLPPRIQTLWAQGKPEDNSRSAMVALKAFIEVHRKVATGSADNER